MALYLEIQIIYTFIGLLVFLIHYFPFSTVPSLPT